MKIKNKIKPFKPPKLPIFNCENPKLTADEKIKLLEKVVEATRLLEKFENKLEYSSIKDAIMVTFSLKESIQSTKIEGTHATFDGYLESQAKGKMTKDDQEVKNYLEALDEGEELLKSIPISTRMFLQLHEIILKGARGENKAPGSYRKIQNYIGPTNKIEDATYIPPEAHLIADYMKNLEEYINGVITDDLHPLIKVAVIHAQFESIHPFLDGNGRLGRIIIILYLIKENIISKSNFFVSEELEKQKFKYYALLNDLRTENPQWFSWLIFFLDSVIKQAESYIEKLDRVEELRKEMANYGIDHRIVFYIFQNPVFQIKGILDMFNNFEKEYHISRQKVQRNLDILIKNKRIYHDNKRRNRIYHFYELLDILS